MSILLIDNYDSFTYNISDYLLYLGADVVVRRNDEATFAEALGSTHIVISPGPCTPNESGISLEIIKKITHIPILGICLGHQAIGQVFGAKIIQGSLPMHAKVSLINHYGGPLFKNIPSNFTAARYHSLIIDKTTMPKELKITATSTPDQVIMAIEHNSYPIYGVQFHPESVASEFGHQILKNFLQLSQNPKTR